LPFEGRTGCWPRGAGTASAIDSGDVIVTTGLVLQELLQGFVGPRARTDIVQRFAALPLLVPDRQDYVDAADIRNVCRRAGVQIGTIDALLTQLCIRHELTLLTTDADSHSLRGIAGCAFGVPWSKYCPHSPTWGKHFQLAVGDRPRLCENQLSPRPRDKQVMRDGA